MRIYFAITIIVLCLTISCKDSKKDRVFNLAGPNKAELEKVLQHFKSTGDKEKIKAAEFLISNMGEDKFSYQGDIISHYDRIIYTYDSLRKNNIIVSDPPVINNLWNSLVSNYGRIDIDNLNTVYDCRTLTAEFLIKNIDQSLNAWKNSPFYNPERFDDFCEYVLPYRIQHEPVEDYREKYYPVLKQMSDTASTVKNLVVAFNQEFYRNQKYRASNIMWKYPLELPVSKMETGKRGSCRQLTTFVVLLMRLSGIPVSIDRAIWGNRSSGHSWNVIIDKDGSIFPFDALARDSLTLAYKPAKIFRKIFSTTVTAQVIHDTSIPESLKNKNEKDVTKEYVSAFDIAVPIEFKNENYADRKHGVICVFDNEEWIPAYWGKIKSDSMYFENMAADVAYIIAYYDNDLIIPASDPFMVKENGSIHKFIVNKQKPVSMRLERKYPLMKRVEDFAWGLRRANAEGADNPEFKDATRFFSVYDIESKVTDVNVENTKKFRYVRLAPSKSRQANFAEVEFYGKKNANAKEEKLSGKIMGLPAITENDPHPYTHAMDNNLETYYQKKKDQSGWVGLDLGQGNEMIVTRVRYCPRSDTNFILQGDEYELLYWENGKWVRAGNKVAGQFNTIQFDNIPSGGLYILRNHTRGKEERIFSYENNKQVWW